jgi:hypothetical protein
MQIYIDNVMGLQINDNTKYLIEDNLILFLPNALINLVIDYFNNDEIIMDCICSYFEHLYPRYYISNSNHHTHKNKY